MSSPTCCNGTTPTTERADVIAIAEAYSNLSDTGRVRFFALLDARVLDRSRRGRSRDRVRAARATGDASRAPRPSARCATALDAADRPAAALVHRLDDGVKFLVDLRADNLRLASRSRDQPRRRRRARPSSTSS